MSRVAALVSGGVDSSVALMRLVDEGAHDITAFYLKIWLEDELAFLGRCPWEEDLALAREVCEIAGVPLEIVPMQREYLDTVIAYSLAGLRRGETPSPDVMCNRMIKFGALVERLGDQYELVASGHYARIDRTSSRARLLRAVDAHKDQTYFLSQMHQQQVARCVFPIGGLLKPEVRQRAHSYGLPTADRPDSQGLCFLGRVPFDEFVRHHLGDQPGEIQDIRSGEVLGPHRGLWYYTIGQRQGLGLAGGPWYVVGKNLDRRRLLVVHGRHLEAHARTRFIIPDPHWITDPPTRSELFVKLRHGPTTLRCSVRHREDGGLAVDLGDHADSGIAPGQFAVFYDGDECLGGGAMAWPPDTP